MIEHGAGSVSKAALWIALLATVAVPHEPAAPTMPSVRKAPPVGSLSGFVPNRGQWPADALYFARSNGIEATLLADALAFQPVRDPEADEPPLAPMILRLPRSCVVEGDGLLATQHHFILGSASASNVPGYERAVYRDVAPGIDLEVRAAATGFAYDLHLAAGASLDDLVLEVEGAESVCVENDTVMGMATAGGRVEQRIGESWEIDGQAGERLPVSSRFKVLDSTGGALRFGFQAPGRDPARAFVLDPSLVYCTYVGGTNQDLLKDMDVSEDGAVYLTSRAAAGAPIIPGAFQPAAASVFDAWVGKLSPDGTTLEWATFLGGSLTDEPFGVNVDHDGTVVVFGQTFSSDFPTTAGTVQPGFVGGSSTLNLFTTRLAPDGGSLAWSTFYGGPGPEAAISSTLFPSGDVLISAGPGGPDPPATTGAFDTFLDPTDVMLVRISADGTQVLFQTYFAGASWALHIDAESNIYLAGFGSSVPTTRGAFKESLAVGDTQDAFVAKLDPAGSQVTWATYLGGSATTDIVRGISVDAASAIYYSGP